MRSSVCFVMWGICIGLGVWRSVRMGFLPIMGRVCSANRTVEGAKIATHARYASTTLYYSKTSASGSVPSATTNLPQSPL